MRVWICINAALHSSHQTSIPQTRQRGCDTLPICFLATCSQSMMKALYSDNVRATGQEAANSQPAPAPSLVLIVEDHEDTRLMLRTILELRGGISVVEAEDGEIAASLVESLHPDLILMDGTLPFVDGFEATRRIRELASGFDVPIVFLSGHAQPASEARAFASGCTDYLVKPFALGELERVLERHLSQERSA
jgi:two-component system, cell cycle response regulator DivK